MQFAIIASYCSEVFAIGNSIFLLSMTINCKGKILNLDSPIVMGILNITPDSFYDGGKLNNDKSLLSLAEKHLTDGATILDIGGYSSKPGASLVSANEEENRVLPAIELILKEFPNAILSIDTFRSDIARKAINKGVAIINDISAGDFDDNMFAVVRELNVPYIIMHIQNNPTNMQNNPQYNDVTKEVFNYLAKKVKTLNVLGVNDIIIDPGFGFGKTIEHNYTLLKNLTIFSSLDVPLLIGLSRKSMIHKVLKNNPKESLNGTTALNMIGLQNGANLLRVHDVKQAFECIKLHNQLSHV